MKHFIIILFLINFSFSYSQSYSSYIKKGDSLYRLENYSESLKNYENAFQINEGNKNDYYNAACTSALAGNKEMSFVYLFEAAKKGWTNLEHLSKDSDLESLHDYSRWDSIINLVDVNLKKHEKLFDKEIAKKLDEINLKDQTLRWLVKDAEEKFSDYPEKMKYFWSLIAIQDSINTTEIVKLIDEKGWLGIDNVGERGNKTIWLVIQHAPLETQEKYLPLLKESVLNGQSKGMYLAYLTDRILMKKGEPQIYGSQVTTDRTTGKKIPYKINDPQHINKIRKEVGLEPIEEYLKAWGIEWEIEQLD